MKIATESTMSPLERSILMLCRTSAENEASSIRADIACRYLEAGTGDSETRAAAERVLYDYFRGIE